jgi:nucleotide-binding universal stress UspA family protein
MYDRILVPTDGSAGVERAVDHAVSLAAEHDAAVHAIHVVNTANFAAMPLEASVEGVEDMLRDDAEAAVRAVVDRAEAAGVTAETVVADGTPSNEIVRYAEEEDCDLIVMGTHGRGGIDRLLLGSVAEKVVRAADVPVMTMQVSDSA